MPKWISSASIHAVIQVSILRLREEVGHRRQGERDTYGRVHAKQKQNSGEATRSEKIIQVSEPGFRAV